MKPALISDWDGVLFETDAVFNAFLEEHYGLRVPEDVYLCGYSMEKLVLERLPAETRPTLEAFYQHVGTEFLISERWHSSVEPVEGSTEAVRALSQKYDIFVATARQPISSPIVEALTQKHFPGIVRGYHYVYRLTDGRLVGTPKSKFAEEFEPHRRAAFIDDNPREIRNMEGVVPSYLFDPKGFHRDVTDCTRVTSWRELADRLL